MPRKLHIPSYRLNKTTGRALVEIAGVTYWLGKHGTPESRQKYDRLIAEWLASGRQPAAPAATVADLTIVELVDRFWIHVEAFYRKPDGTPTSEVENFRHALRPLKALYGPTPAAAFGPKSLRAVRQRMIELKWCRSNINKQVARLKLAFKWAVSQELIPPTVHHALATVAGLRKGKSDAKEKAPVRPVPDADVDAIRPHVSRQVWAMIQLQRLTGMRPGEVVAIRTCDIDRGGKVWTYKPADHKTAHHGHDRTIFIGPKAQAVLIADADAEGRNPRSWLRPDLTSPLFQPAEAEAERLAAIHAKRVREGTPLKYGNRPGTNRVRRPKRKPGDRYDVGAYRRAIERGCEKAFAMPGELRQPPGPPGAEATAGELAAWGEREKAWREARRAWHAAHCWHPHRLRHNAATFLRRDYGIDAAKVILGHRTLSATQVYAEQDVAKAMRIMGEVG